MQILVEEVNEMNIRKNSLRFSCLCSALLAAFPAEAQETQVIGKVIAIEGHITPTCRRLMLQRSDGVIVTFRLPNTGNDQSILSVSMTALATNHSLTVDYDPTITTGCGTEPQITYVTLLAGS